MRILVVEDQPELNGLIAKRLKEEHYSVDACFDGEEAESFLDCAEYDAIVMDIMMPKKDGLAVLRELRGKKDKTPVLLLTAKDAIDDRVAGLDSGADDYLIKPFAFDELLARLRVILRRDTGAVGNVFEVGNLVVDCDSRTVKRDAVSITLSAKEFSVLEYLIRNSGKVLTREKISQHLWNYDYEGESNIVDVYIRYLRKKLDEDYEPKLIHTVRGVGYVLRIEE